VLRERWVSSFAADLAERPWLDSRYLEWVIVDSLVCNRVRRFGVAVLGGEWNLKDVLFAGGAALEGEGMEQVLRGIVRAKIVRWLIRLILFFILPVAGIWYCGFWADSCRRLPSRIKQNCGI
jgi:hypothetical protein